MINRREFGAGLAGIGIAARSIAGNELSVGCQGYRVDNMSKMKHLRQIRKYSC